VYQPELPFRDGSYTYHPVVAEVEADNGMIGWGEMCPLSESYDGAFAGWESVLRTLGPVLLGEDPRNPIRNANMMDASVRGHTYPKSALDMGCWDLTGQAFGVSLCELFGGRTGESVEAFVHVGLEHPGPGAYAATLVSEGYRSIQVKIGRIPERDAERISAIRKAVGDSIELVADANCAYSVADARRFLYEVDDRKLSIEQPCATLDELAALRAHCPYPLVLDESIVSITAVLDAHSRHVADGLTIKLAKLGGLTRARVILDVAVALGIQARVEDMGGSEISTAAAVHLAVATPQRLRLQTTDAPRRVAVQLAKGLAPAVDGRLTTPRAAGVGVEPHADALGPRLFQIG